MVEHDGDHVGVGREGFQVAAMEGGIGVLLRIEYEDEPVDQPDQPVHLVAMRSGRGVVVR